MATSEFSGSAVTGRCLVVHPFLKTSAGAPQKTMRSPEARLEEAIGLAEAINLTVVASEIVRLSTYRPATLIGMGSVESLAQIVEDQAITVVVVDATVTPVQQRNLERALQSKVIDRTGLILEIFGARARTYEGRLQVELAALTYQRSRLVRSWTHLERQRGGFGFLGGPGESQLEIDRRLIDERTTRLKRELEEVKRTRDLHRKARRRVPYPIVALVGYTNAGKSTLFNRLTKATVLAQDLLFATLDPTMRTLTLPSGRSVILSDTVGFISELPTHLVAAFRATLEEVISADLVVHVRDVAHPDSEAQKADVLNVLTSLGLGAVLESGMVEALNKIDLLTADGDDAPVAIGRDAMAVPVSALTGDGCTDLLNLLDRLLEKHHILVPVDLSISDGAAIAWLYQHGEVVERQDDEAMAHLVVKLDPVNHERFLAGQKSRPATPEPTTHPD